MLSVKVKWLLQGLVLSQEINMEPGFPQFPLICESLNYIIFRKSTWGRMTMRRAVGGNSGEIPLWRWISSCIQGEAEIWDSWYVEGLIFSFSWTREKGESREPHGPILGLECPNALLCLLAALQCYTHSATALHSSPVGNMAEAGKLEAAQGKNYSLFFFRGWSTSLYVWIWLDIFFLLERLPVFI